MSSYAHAPQHRARKARHAAKWANGETKRTERMPKNQTTPLATKNRCNNSKRVTVITSDISGKANDE
jgi:hypothetical protein